MSTRYVPLRCGIWPYLRYSLHPQHLQVSLCRKAKAYSPSATTYHGYATALANKWRGRSPYPAWKFGDLRCHRGLQFDYLQVEKMSQQMLDTFWSDQLTDIQIRWMFLPIKKPCVKKDKIQTNESTVNLKVQMSSVWTWPGVGPSCVSVV